MTLQPHNSPALDAWLSDYARLASEPDYVDRFVRWIDDGILGRVPAVRSDPLLVEDLDRSTRAHWLSFLQMMILPEYRLLFPEPAADFVRSVARRGLELGVLLKVYRAGNLYLFEHFTEVIDSLPADGPTRDETLVFLWTRGGNWLDDSMERITQIYYEEQAQALESRIAGKIETVRALLEGLPTPDDPSRTLGHSLSQWQIGFVVWVPTPQPGAARLMQDVARSLANTLGAPPPLTIPRSSRDLWGWAATPTSPDLARALEALEGFEPGSFHLAIGMPARGAAGFRTSNQEACEAQRLVISATDAPAVVRYDEVELLCLAHAETDAFRRMVTRELGELAGASSGIAQTRQTLLCYLTSGASVEAAATRLFVHRNTVRYRLNRAEELMGHRINERVGHVELALRYIDLFGAQEPEELTPAAPRRRSRATPASSAEAQTS